MAGKVGATKELSKRQQLNKSLEARKISGASKVYNGLIQAKFVKVKKDRWCSSCKTAVVSGEVALTAFRVVKYNKLGRYWVCCECAVIKLDTAEREEREGMEDRKGSIFSSTKGLEHVRGGFGLEDQNERDWEGYAEELDDWDELDWDDGTSSNGS